MKRFNTICDFYLKDKRVLIRSDLNVPVKNKKVLSDHRIKAAIPTIEYALKHGAKVMVTSHFGRPEKGDNPDDFSLQPIVDYLNEYFDIPVRLVKNYLNGTVVRNGEIVVLENVRLNHGEKACLDYLSKKYAALCDIFVMDAFGALHRKNSSTYGVLKFAPKSCAGLLVEKEVSSLSKVLDNSERPRVAIIGGSKVSNKLKLLKYLAEFYDYILVGGGIANTFIASKRYSVGQSIYEQDLFNETNRLSKICNIPIPKDVLVAQKFDETASARPCSVFKIERDDRILDLGQETIKEYVDIIKKAKTILWNGPIGVFEFPNFSKGTEMVAKAIAESDAFVVAGGGDTVSAIEMFGVRNQISYISTGGGALVGFLVGKSFLALDMLENIYQSEKQG